LTFQQQKSLRHKEFSGWQIRCHIHLKSLQYPENGFLMMLHFCVVRFNFIFCEKLSRSCFSSFFDFNSGFFFRTRNQCDDMDAVSCTGTDQFSPVQKKNSVSFVFLKMIFITFLDVLSHFILKRLVQTVGTGATLCMDVTQSNFRSLL
jgi:hypothetical protein